MGLNSKISRAAVEGPSPLKHEVIVAAQDNLEQKENLLLVGATSGHPPSQERTSSRLSFFRVMQRRSFDFGSGCPFA